LRIVLHRAVLDDDVLRRQWNDLVPQMEQPEVFYTYEWALAVFRAYGGQLIPLLFLAYEEDSLVGLVALATNSSQETVFLTGTTADYCDFICHPQRRKELVDAVFAMLQELGSPRLQLANLPAHSATVPALKAIAQASDYQSFFRPAYFCARVLLSTAEHKSAMKQVLSRKQMVSRHVKGMKKLGTVEVRHLKSRESLVASLPDFMTAHTARFLATGRIGNLARAERRDFLEKLAGLLSPRQWITMSCLMVGERPVAWNYGFQFGGSWFWYQPTFDSAFQKYYPGLCLLTKLIEQACDSPGINRVDLGLGAEGYKERVTTDGCQTLHVTMTTSSLALWKEHVRYRMSAAVRSVPHLENGIRSSLAYMASLRKRVRTEGLQGLGSSLFSSSEIVFLQWQQDEFKIDKNLASGPNLIHPVDLRLLATTATQYSDDPDTAAYLLRAAKRLELKRSQGFALVSPEGVPLQLCWVANSHDFDVAGLERPVNLLPADALLIFDCWAPWELRRHGHCSEVLSILSVQLNRAGKLPWTFAASTNAEALAAAERAGFVRSFSLTQKRILFLSKMVESEFSRVPGPMAKVSSAA
jgi:CelD/BcsL family acetyltransferase involved in cellulose biosynthesis